MATWLVTQTREDAENLNQYIMDRIPQTQNYSYVFETNPLPELNGESGFCIVDPIGQFTEEGRRDYLLEGTTIEYISVYDPEGTVLKMPEML